MSRTEYFYKMQALKAARELGYKSSVIEKIKKATTENEIEKILRNARKEEI